MERKIFDDKIKELSEALGKTHVKGRRGAEGGGGGGGMGVDDRQARQARCAQVVVPDLFPELTAR